MKSQFRTRRLQKKVQSGFTLVELLVVMTITVILLSVISVPLIQSFQIVENAQGEANTQMMTKRVLDQITNEVENSPAIRDGSGKVAIRIPRSPDRPEDQVEVILDQARLDLYKLAQDNEKPADLKKLGFWNPNIERIDPTLHAPKGQVSLPATPGSVMVRYFIGLKDPLVPPSSHSKIYSNYQSSLYWNRYQKKIMNVRTAKRPENLYVLYRAEIRADEYQDFFERDSNGEPIFDDPYFFMLHGETGLSKIKKIHRILNWKKRGRIITETKRYDMILPVVNPNTKQIIQKNADVPLVRPLIQFQLHVAKSDLARPEYFLGKSDTFAPESYQTIYGDWTWQQVKLYPASEGKKWSPSQPYIETEGEGLNNFKIIQISSIAKKEELFDMKKYLEPRTAFPFNEAMNAKVFEDEEVATYFVPFKIDPKGGQIFTSFEVKEYSEIPRFLTDTSLKEEKKNPTDFIQEISNYSINQKFNALWILEEKYAKQNQQKRIFNLDRSLYARRFVMLNTQNQEGKLSPLALKRAKIVPGSEVVIGPDQLSLDEQPTNIRYRRVKSRPIGANQYLIHYLDQPHPENLEELVFQPDFLDPGLKKVLMDHVLLPAYQKGYIEFQSNPERPLPLGEISISYRFQFNQQNDLFAVDYGSGEMISIILTSCHYPVGSLLEPQLMTLSRTLKVRNFIR